MLSLQSSLLTSSKSYSQAILFLQSFCRHLMMNLLTPNEMVTEGSKKRQVSSMVLIREAIELDSKGQWPYSISQKITPTDQISALTEQASPLKTYGAMYKGEPSMVLVMHYPSSYLQKPKSASLKFPSLMSTFSGFRSRCMMLCFLSTLRPFISWLKILSAVFQSMVLLFLIISCSVPPSQNSYTKQQLFLVCSSSQKRTMQGHGSSPL